MSYIPDNNRDRQPDLDLLKTLNHLTVENQSSYSRKFGERLWSNRARLMARSIRKPYHKWCKVVCNMFVKQYMIGVMSVTPNKHNSVLRQINVLALRTL